MPFGTTTTTASIVLTATTTILAASKSPTGKAEWQFSTIQSILSNERYKGDAIINKTYITDCISKKVRVNNGERPKYYVENSHPAIIDSATFGRVQEELARRSGKRKISRKAKTEQGKYSSKYALTELLVCGECKSAYRRCTWTASGKKKIVWRCINRIEYAKKYCHNSPSVEESVLQRAVMAAIMETANQNAEVLRTLKLHIGMGWREKRTRIKASTYRYGSPKSTQNSKRCSTEYPPTPSKPLMRKPQLGL